ncbi:unnamed protein product [Linum tenue]|uniref:Uncharacterized protein n=1 Tax=Linum tenue TaxID=586396 RepID=A0AAV0NLF1_9ROSI|nr:unnamed protein product [Linum tenue]
MTKCRLTITAARTPSLLVSTKLNEANIIKKFPNMDACAAFAYVLNAEATKKYFGSRSLAQETRMARSLLHNLLDVVQKLQKARIESINFVDATFISASVGFILPTSSHTAYKFPGRRSLIQRHSQLKRKLLSITLELAVSEY